MQLLSLLGVGLLVLAAHQAPPDQWTDRSPHRSDFASGNGLTFHYLDWGGDGEPLLLLAGLFGSAHGFDDLAPQLIDNFRVLSLTRRGHGRSSRPASGYSVTTLVDDIPDFLDLMKIGRVHLAGVSLGGVEAALFAERYPDRVATVMYLDSAYDRSAAFERQRVARLAGNPSSAGHYPFPQSRPAHRSPLFASGT